MSRTPSAAASASRPASHHGGAIALRVLAAALTYLLAGEFATALSFALPLPQAEALLLAGLLGLLVPIGMVVAVFAVASPWRALFIVLVPLVVCRAATLAFLIAHAWAHGVLP